MKTIIATLLASAAGASIAAAPLDKDPQAATRNCSGMSGHEKTVCAAEARADRAHAQADALAARKASQKSQQKAFIAAENADYALAQARCAGQSASARTQCLHDARVEHATALADLRSGKMPDVSTRVGSSTTAATGAGATGTPQDNSKEAAAMRECRDAAGAPKTGCLIDNGTSPSGTALRNKMATAADRTEDAAATAADRTKDAAATAAEKTREAAHEVAQRTEAATDRAAVKADHMADRAAQKTENATATAAENTREVAADVKDKSKEVASRTGDVVEDSVITTRVKADIFKEPNLKSLGIHVETEKGVVMLSGFVNSKNEAQRAVDVARGVKGVSEVKSALKVK
ncbi:MAG TPA: BON domain-containing protein [Telluria sp.]|nr:BON domain-containing protein [Telluria sp.]